MPTLTCAACLREGNPQPHHLRTPVTIETPKQARHHFDRDHLPKMDAKRRAVHVEFPDDGIPTFDLREP